MSNINRVLVNHSPLHDIRRIVQEVAEEDLQSFYARRMTSMTLGLWVAFYQQLLLQSSDTILRRYLDFQALSSAKSLDLRMKCKSFDQELNNALQSSGFGLSFLTVTAVMRKLVFRI